MAYKKLGAPFPVVCTASAAAAASSFDAINTGLSITDRVGWLLTRIEDYSPKFAAASAFNGDGDEIRYGLSTNNQVDTTSLLTLAPNPAVKWLASLTRQDFGAAASGGIQPTPRIFNYSQSEDDGILMVPQPLYVFIASTGTATNGTCHFRAWFQAISLTDSDYFNLVQQSQIITG